MKLVFTLLAGLALGFPLGIYSMGIVATTNLYEGIFYVATILAVGYSVIQYRENSQHEMTKWISQLYERFYGNKELLTIFDRIDWEDAAFLQTENREFLLQRDQLLNFFEFVAILHKRKELEGEDIKRMFDYPLRRFAEVVAIRNYLSPNGYEELDALLRKLSYLK